MTTPWRPTDLSADPDSFEIGHLDREALAFDAGEAITAATAIATNLATGSVAAAVVSDVIVAAEGATVVVENVVRDTTYELAITFERSDGLKWTRTLVLECVA